MVNPTVKYSHIPTYVLEEFHSDNYICLKLLDSETVWQIDSELCQPTKIQHHYRIGGSIVWPAKIKVLEKFKG